MKLFRRWLGLSGLAGRCALINLYFGSHPRRLRGVLGKARLKASHGRTGWSAAEQRSADFSSFLCFS